MGGKRSTKRKRVRLRRADDIADPEGVPERMRDLVLARRREGASRAQLKQEFGGLVDEDAAKRAANWADMVVAREQARGRNRRRGFFELLGGIACIAAFLLIVIFAGVEAAVGPYGARGRVSPTYLLGVGGLLVVHGGYRFLRPSTRGFRRFRT